MEISAPLLGMWLLGQVLHSHGASNDTTWLACSLELKHARDTTHGPINVRHLFSADDVATIK